MASAFGLRLRRLREAKKLTLQQVAPSRSTPGSRPPLNPPSATTIFMLVARPTIKGKPISTSKPIEAYLKGTGSLPVNVKFIIEGEEEIGGPNPETFIAAHQDLLKADIAVISDTAMITPDRPAIVYGLRGLYVFFMDVTGPDHDLHSGTYGGAVNNPINALCHIISHLKDADRKVLVPGFYDRVRPLSPEERHLLAQYPRDAALVQKETNAPQVWGETEFTVNERMGARPTLDVNGIIGGYTDAGTKNIIPSSVHAKMSFRNRLDRIINFFGYPNFSGEDVL